nr:methyltransferase domain-containing protein [uncultured Rhodopila sp.]
MDRVSRLLGTATRSSRIIEIGAGYSPAAPKSHGWNTHVVDHTTQEALRAKYADAAVDVRAIEPVDTVWQQGPLHEAVPAALVGQVDLIIASHVLEHLPDLIGFFASAARLAAPSGILSIALPDRRYCFDCFRPWTTTGGLLEAHHRRAIRHDLKTAFDHMAYSAVVDGRLGWGAEPIARPTLLDSFAAAAATAASFSDGMPRHYQDYHAWQFTPAGFELITLELGELGLLDWRMEELNGPENFEFFVSLRRGAGHRMPAAALQAVRRDLLLRQLAETREQIDFILATPGGPVPAAGQAEASHHGLAARLAGQEVRLSKMEEVLASVQARLKPAT